MQARYFRYLIENRDDGFIHSGCIYDRLEEKTTNYIYMAGNHHRTTSYIPGKESAVEQEKMPENLDFLIVGGYTAAYIEKLIAIVKNHQVRTVILPYLTPVQRLIHLIEINGKSTVGRECIRFLQDPYQYIKNLSIPNVYFLYGNGESMTNCPEELETGVHFEHADTETLNLIKEMEGYHIPVVRAGYLIENRWLFHFGCYGPNIKLLFNFTREYFGHLENIYKFSEQETEDYMWQIEKLLKDFKSKFVDSPVASVAMFQGPLDSTSAENNSFMVQKEFTAMEQCHAWIANSSTGKCNCEIKCTHCKDFDTMQSHKSRDRDDTRFGMLVLGNTNLNRYLPEVVTRFWGLRERIRAIAVPNSGVLEDWNSQVLGFSSGQDRMYWLCSKQENTAADVVRDIALSNPGNRFVNIAQDMGCCFSGYLIPRDEIDYL